MIETARDFHVTSFIATLRTVGIGSNCPEISGTVQDFLSLSRVPERCVNCPEIVLTHVVYQETTKEV